MNREYGKTLQRSLPTELNRIEDEKTLESLADPKVLLSAPAMKQLEKAFLQFGDRGPSLFKKTVEAIHGSLEASLKYVFLIGAVTALISFLLILIIPEVSIEAEVQDKKQSGQRKD
jgi:hypothetical protein